MLTDLSKYIIATESYSDENISDVLDTNKWKEYEKYVGNFLKSTPTSLIKNEIALRNRELNSAIQLYAKFIKELSKKYKYPDKAVTIHTKYCNASDIIRINHSWADDSNDQYEYEAGYFYDNITACNITYPLNYMVDVYASYVEAEYLEITDAECSANNMRYDEYIRKKHGISLLDICDKAFKKLKGSLKPYETIIGCYSDGDMKDAYFYLTVRASQKFISSLKESGMKDWTIFRKEK